MTSNKYIDDIKENYKSINELIVFDLSFSEGHRAFEFSTSFPNSKIYTFECVSDKLAKCRENIKAYPNIILIEKKINNYNDHEYTKLDNIIDNLDLFGVDIILSNINDNLLPIFQSLGRFLTAVKYILVKHHHSDPTYEMLKNFLFDNGFLLLENINDHKNNINVVYKRYPTLISFANNIFSQRGQDGILSKIFDILSIKTGYFIEFGAWDGIYLSNCRNLVLHGWEGCFIEGDPEKYNTLVSNYTTNDKIKCLCKYISTQQGQTINDIHRNDLQSRDIDLLSIDVDGCDYEILETLEFKPLVIVIEGGFSWHPCFRSKVPNEIARQNLQQPLYASIKIARSKGYEPICFNQDLFLLRKDYYDKYKFFQHINNNHYSLWMTAYNNVFSDEDREYLDRVRQENIIVDIEQDYAKYNFRDIFDIVISVSDNDLGIINYIIDHIKENVIGFRNIYLISKTKIDIEDCINISEDIFPFTFSDINDIYPQNKYNKYHFQQLLELYIGLIIPDIMPWYLILTTRTLLKEKTKFFDLDTHKPLFMLANVEHNLEYEYMIKLHPSLAQISYKLDKNFTHILINTRYTIELFRLIKEYTKQVFWKSVLDLITKEPNISDTSIYDIYLVYLMSHHHNDIGIKIIE